jgi:hypothetical protein
MSEQQDQLSGISNQEFFIQLIYKMGNLEDATVVHLLIAKRAHVGPWKTSARQISSLLGSTIPKLNVQRCLDRLRRMDVITTRVQANTSTEISLSQSTLIEVMKRPLPVSSDGFIPGLSSMAIPLLSDPDFLQAISATTATDGPTMPIESSNEQNSAAMVAIH